MTYTSSDLPNSVQEKMDARVTVKVPATANRKAYEYTKNTGESPTTPKRKADVGLGVGLAAGSAAILGGLAAASVAKKGQRAQDEKGRTEELNKRSQEAEVTAKSVKEKIKQQESEYEARYPSTSEKNLEEFGRKWAAFQEKMKKPIETAEESDAKRRAAGSKAIKENDEKRAREAAEDEENKKRIKEEDYRKYQEYQKSPEYKKNVEKFGEYYRERVKEAKTSPEYKEAKAARKAAREARKGQGREASGGFAKRQNSLAVRIDNFVQQLGGSSMSYSYEEIPHSVQERMDNQITVEVPATANRKAYTYTKNGGMKGKSVGSKKISGMSKAGFVKAGAAGAAGAAAILALRILAGRKQKQKELEKENEKGWSDIGEKNRDLNKKVRKNSLHERIDSFIADLSSKV